LRCAGQPSAMPTIAINTSAEVNVRPWILLMTTRPQLDADPTTLGASVSGCKHHR
jgi:hypothetical protein